jgi:hypothetical protein
MGTGELRISTRPLLALCLGIALGIATAGCTHRAPPRGAAPQAPLSGRATSTVTRGCPVTLPGTAGPAPGPSRGATGVSANTLFGAESAYGNAGLWVGGLGPGGVITARPEFVDADGSIGWKFGWWRSVPGTLRITGRRLDRPAGPVRADIPAGYGDLGFQSSGVHFPSAGCWQITGAVGGARLTFVTLIRVPG